MPGTPSSLYLPQLQLLQPLQWPEHWLPLGQPMHLAPFFLALWI